MARDIPGRSIMDIDPETTRKTATFGETPLSRVESENISPLEQVRHWRIFVEYT